MVIGIGPKAGEFKAIAGFFFFGFATFGILDGVKACAVGIIFGVGAIGNDEYLHIFKEAAARPEGVPLVALDLVEGLTNGDAAAFEFHMDQGQTVNENGHVVAIVVFGALLLAVLVLVQHLQAIVMDILFINDTDIFRGAVVTLEAENGAFLNNLALFRNMGVRIGDFRGKETLPFLVGEVVLVQLLNALTQIGNQIRLLVNFKIGISLLG